jgi:hypothetical protein
MKMIRNKYNGELWQCCVGHKSFVFGNYLLHWFQYVSWQTSMFQDEERSWFHTQENNFNVINYLTSVVGYNLALNFMCLISFVEHQLVEPQILHPVLDIASLYKINENCEKLYYFNSELLMLCYLVILDFL